MTKEESEIRIRASYVLSLGVSILFGLSSFLGQKWLAGLETQISEIKAMEEERGPRIASLETQANGTEKRLDKIDAKLDHLLDLASRRHQ